MAMEFHNNEREEVAIRNANCILMRLTIRIFEEMAFFFYFVSGY